MRGKCDLEPVNSIASVKKIAPTGIPSPSTSRIAMPPGALEPDAANEIGERFTGYGNEHPVEMERRESSDGGKPLQRELVGKVGLNVIDGAVEAPFIPAPMR